MNKKEIAELKKTLKPGSCCIDRIVACHVTQSKERKPVTIGDIRMMDDNCLEKYLDIFKKSISGSIGRQLNCLSFPKEAEEAGGIQELLCEIEKSGLDDEERVDELFERIVKNYEDKGSYCILLMHGNYDVIRKSSDDSPEESDEVYSHLICSICPVTLAKPFLSYNDRKCEIEEGTPQWTVNAPQCAFLFPSFTDRTSNIHEVLVYNKKASEVNPEIIQGVLECSIPASAEEQANAFVASTQAAFGNEISYEQVSSIYDALSEQAGESDDETTLSPESIKSILESENASDMEAFDQQFSSMIRDGNIFLSNIVDRNKFVVKMEGLTISTNGDTKDLISVREMDGHKCLVISPNGQMEVNGMVAKMT